VRELFSAGVARAFFAGRARGVFFRRKTRVSPVNSAGKPGFHRVIPPENPVFTAEFARRGPGIRSSTWISPVDGGF
jgi:hypothetical protein